MRELKRDKERLAHILDAIMIIENGLNSYSKDELLDNPLLYYGFIPQLKVQIVRYYEQCG